MELWEVWYDGSRYLVSHLGYRVALFNKTGGLLWKTVHLGKPFGLLTNLLNKKSIKALTFFCL